MAVSPFWKCPICRHEDLEGWHLAFCLPVDTHLCVQLGRGGGSRDALEGKGPQRWPLRRLDRRLGAVGGGYCRLQMPVERAIAVRETVAGCRLGALFGGAPSSQAPLGEVHRKAFFHLRQRGCGFGQDAWLWCCLQPVAPVGLSPITSALSLNPVPP